jgi:hypothetical protein
MNSLIIHPADPSTDFLKDIYASWQDYDLITGSCNNRQISRALQNAERLFLLGHGCTSGLLAIDQFDDDRLTVVDKEHVPYLKNKPHSLYIWCHANVFVEEHGLEGFYTGMFISEMAEAKYFGLEVSEAEISFSNALFAQIVGQNLHLAPRELLEVVQKAYGKFEATHQVIEFNLKRLYCC